MRATRGKQGATHPLTPGCERPRVDRGRTCAGRAPLRDASAATLGQTGATVSIDGFAAQTTDFDASPKRNTPIVVTVALDATIIRGILLPATMKLLGDWNWWLPRKLDWLPQVELEGAKA
jgi:putative drug exporter of the RND superfamily